MGNKDIYCWGLIGLILMFSIYNKWDRSGQFVKFINTPRVESAEESSLNEKAEKLPTLKISEGLWKHQGDGYSVAILFQIEKRFVITIEADKDKYTASGTYMVKGSTIVFKVEQGPKGIFPTSGRQIVEQTANGNLKIGKYDFVHKG